MERRSRHRAPHARPLSNLDAGIIISNRDIGIRSGAIGQGAAISLFLLPILILVAVLMLRFARKVEVT